MNATSLALRSLRHYWRTNLAVVGGVAVAVSVLAGALVVGESVRASLRELAVARLGRTDHLVASTGFFRGQLAGELEQHERFRGAFERAVGLIAVDGLVEHDRNGRRASGVAVYGVDDRFFAFHDVQPDGGAPSGRQALVSPALARELDLAADDGVMIRLQQPSAIPASSLHGRRDELGRMIRATVRGVLAKEHMGEFSLRPQQG
ncbi:MAG TPA: ABC transporter permease, partial [Vicinamibacterales bacterium]